MKEAILFETQRGNIPVQEFLNEPDKHTRAKVSWAINLLEQQGEYLHRPFVDHLEGSIKESRVRRASDNIRILFFFFRQKYVVLVHGFRKKTDAVPARDIQKAKGYMNDFMDRVQKGDIQL